MKLIVGLGNPGEKYKGTRHNLGQQVVDQLAGQIIDSQWSAMKKFRSSIINHRPAIILAKPATFMNRSGVAVKRLLVYFKVEPANLWIVHDDVDLPLGKIKVQIGRGAAGHHGVESIIREIESQEFVRFRLGIGRPGRDSKAEITDKQTEEFVLSKFSPEEKPAVARTVTATVEAIKLALKEGLERARSRPF